MEVSGQLHAPAADSQGKSPWYPLDTRLGGTKSRSGRGGEEKNSQPPSGIELQNTDRPARSLPTELSRLLRPSDASSVMTVLRNVGDVQGKRFRGCNPDIDGSGSCPIANFHIRDTETSGSAVC
jgi:hypothetical protein